jgi:hypothetical protein
METSTFALLGGALLIGGVLVGGAAGAVPGVDLNSIGVAVPGQDGPGNGNQGNNEVKAFSFVALCSADEASLTSGSVTASDYKEGDSTEPIEVEWSSDPAANYVVYKAGPELYVVTYDTASNGGTIGVGDGVSPSEYGDASIGPSTPCGEGYELAKHEWVGDGFEQETA